MFFTFDTCYSVVDCKHEYRINLFNKKSNYNLKINRKVKLLSADDDGEVLFNSESERVALRRAKVAVIDLALCNSFEYFGTITFADSKVGDLLHNPQALKESIVRLFDNYKQFFAPDFEYILIPEYGKRTHRLHFHFVCKGINPSDLFFNIHRKLDWKLTTSRYGYTQITRIKNSNLDKVRVAKYCAKYLSKDSLKICKHRYFASRSLKRPERTVVEDDDESMFVSDWLIANGFDYFCDLDYARCFSIPARVYHDLMNAVQEWRKPPKPYLIDFPSFILSPWDFGFNPKQINYKEILAC